MSDLRESGDIEQESDIIITMYRDEVYHNAAVKGEVELATIKNRHGPIGNTKCHFEGRRLLFSDFGLDGGSVPKEDLFDRGETRSIHTDG
jgi:replicative DNA helicase